MTTEQNVAHGLTAALAAVALPDAWLSFGERVAMAVIVAACSTLASKLVSLVWKKAGLK